MFEYILILFLCSFLIILLPKKLNSILSKLAPLLLVAGFIYYLNGASKLSDQSVISFNHDWIESLGISLSLKYDFLAAFFSLLITLIGSCVFLYADAYFKKKKLGFTATLLFFTASMLGIVQADNTILFFTFWELTSLSSFMLIAHNNDLASAKDSSRSALFITVGGGLVLLFGFLLLSLGAQQTGLTLAESLSFSSLISVELMDNQLAFYSLFFIAVGIATKSAQFPFHFWLPLAMSGPTPVSSFLHSATMVKAGIFLMLRIYPIFSDHTMWRPLFVTMGLVTMMIGAFLCISQKDLKKVLAYSTISALGVLVMLIGEGSEAAVKACFAFLIAHAFYKASLFQVVGNLDLSAENKNVLELFGMGKIIPITAFAALFSGLSFIGMPPFLGYYGKELTYLMGFSGDFVRGVILVASFVSFVFLSVMAISLFYYPFWSKEGKTVGRFSQNKISLTAELSPFFLAISGLLVGIFPGVFTEFLGEGMINSFFKNGHTYKLKLWHGTDFVSVSAFVLSIGTLLISFFSARKIVFINNLFCHCNEYFVRISFKPVFDKVLNGFMLCAEKFTAFYQNGSLASYMRVILVGVLLVVSFPTLKLFEISSFHFSFPSLISLGIILTIAVPLLLAVKNPNRLIQIIYLALSGFGIVMLFALFSAADLAITQLSVEALSILFVLILLRKLPRYSDKKSHSYFNIIISFSVSIVILLLFHFLPIPQSFAVSDYYIKNSLVSAYGRNIVNVILVDFRSLDTFGEVVVIAIAATGVVVLLKDLKTEKKDV